MERISENKVRSQSLQGQNTAWAANKSCSWQTDLKKKKDNLFLSLDYLFSGSKNQSVLAKV